jgi:hypothetical protein
MTPLSLLGQQGGVFLFDTTRLNHGRHGGTFVFSVNYIKRRSANCSAPEFARCCLLRMNVTPATCSMSFR